MANVGGAISGAGQGAAGGAAIGSVVPGIGTAIGAGVGALGGLLGNLLGGSDDQAERDARAAALAKIMGVSLPQAQDLMVNLEKQQVAGTYNPELQGTVTEGPSAMKDIVSNPQARAAQMAALSQLQNLGNTGLTAADRMALTQIQNESAGKSNALNKSILANNAARGMAGSGATLAAQLIGSQTAANQGAQNGLNVAAQAQQKALQAMSNAGALGSQIEGQQFGEEAQKAAAADAISRFNSANRQNVIGANTTSKNQGQMANLQNLQSVMNANTGITNQQAELNSQAKQRAAQLALQQAGMAAGQYNTNATSDAQHAQNTAGMWAGVGQAANGVLSSGAFNGLFNGGNTDNNQLNLNEGETKATYNSSNPMGPKEKPAADTSEFENNYNSGSYNPFGA